MIRRARHIGAVALALLALTACDDGAGPAPNAPEPIFRSASAEPGSANTPVRFARTVLQTACIDTQPDFQGATRALARAGGFAQSAKTGTFFHQRYDMSVKVVPGRCSMVVGTSGARDSLAQLGTLNSVQTGVPRVFGGRSYYAFFVSGA
ncbi:hypothetical protein [uncultured Tateyamaria sp.]|uniref:hypothetical protein n=1 Tax=Tateyamaria sp. 1078 TaxID=3417464 RepID=UPI00261D475E|nr:hypothetical protein [uncultured Tateyamaria sp.]